MESYPQPHATPAQHACAKQRRNAADHGYGMYSRGCRCDICRAAKRDYMRARRETGLEPNRRGLVEPNGRRPVTSLPTHGNLTAYRRGCRCYPCMLASTEAARERRLRKQAS